MQTPPGADTTQAAGPQMPARFKGYSWRSMHDEVLTYRVRELRELLTELGFNVKGMSRDVMMAHALETLRRAK